MSEDLTNPKLTPYSDKPNRSNSLAQPRMSKTKQDLDEIKSESKPILEDLASIGFQVDWISDLYAKKYNYKSAIPLLLQWLPHVKNTSVKESLVRAVSVPWAKPVAAPILIREFRKEGPGYSSLKWAIGNGLSVVADDSVCADLANLAQDREHGKSREMIVLALGNIKLPQAEDTLIELLKDDDVAGFAIMALGKMKSEKSYPKIEKFLDHSRSWVRREAKKALARINKK